MPKPDNGGDSPNVIHPKGFGEPSHEAANSPGQSFPYTNLGGKNFPGKIMPSGPGTTGRVPRNLGLAGTRQGPESSREDSFREANRENRDAKRGYRK